MASATEAAPVMDWRQLLQPELQGAVTIAISWAGTDNESLLGDEETPRKVVSGTEEEKESAADERRKCSDAVPGAHRRTGRKIRYSPHQVPRSVALGSW
jgi:hypothetical protein